jgi:excisionase family DNA binding protein
VEDQTQSLSEVAGLMGVSERTVRRWIKSGRLKAYKPGRDYRIPETGLRAFIEESEVSPKAQAPLSPEPSFNDVLKEERRFSMFAEAIADAADKWASDVSRPSADHLKLIGIVEASLDLMKSLIQRIEVEWKALSNQERHAIINLFEQLNGVGTKCFDRLEQSAEATTQEVEEVDEYKRRREEIIEMTRRIYAA